MREPWRRKGTNTIIDQTTTTTGLTDLTTDGDDEVSVPGVPETPEASLPTPTTPSPLSPEQRRTLEWVRRGSRDDSAQTFDYARDVHRLEVAVPERPRSEGSEPRQAETEKAVKDTVDTPYDSDNEIETLPHIDLVVEEDVGEEDVVEEDVVEEGDVVEEAIEEVADAGAEESQDEQSVSSEGEIEEESRPISIERPSTSLGFRPGDERPEEDDDYEENVAATGPAVDISIDYELLQPDLDAVTEAEVVENISGEEEAAEENVETLPIIEQPEERPRSRRGHQDQLSPEKRSEMMELRSKLELLRTLREREKEESRTTSSTTTTEPQQQLQEEVMGGGGGGDNSAIDELPELSEERRTELLDLRTKLGLFLAMREQQQTTHSTSVESSISATEVEEEEEGGEMDEPSSETNQDLEFQGLGGSTTEPGNDNEIPPPDEEPEEEDDDDDGVEEEEEQKEEEQEEEEEEEPEEPEYDGLVDPYSDEGAEILTFIKAWLLLPDELGALEVFHQVANLRDSLAFVPTWVPTKHILVRADETLLLRNHPVHYEINWHFVARLRSLRWRSILLLRDDIGAADRAWLEGFLREMEAPSFIVGAKRRPPPPEEEEGNNGRRRRRRRRRRNNKATTTTTTTGEQGGERRRSTLLHQVEVAEPLRPYEQEAVHAANQSQRTRHAHEAAVAMVGAIYANTEERAAWIDDRADDVRGDLEEVEQSLLRLLDNLTSLDSHVGSVGEVHGQEYADLAAKIQGLPRKQQQQ